MSDENYLDFAEHLPPVDWKRVSNQDDITRIIWNIEVPPNTSVSINTSERVVVAKCACVHPDRHMCIAIRTNRSYEEVMEVYDECQCYCHDEEDEEENEG